MQNVQVGDVIAEPKDINYPDCHRTVLEKRHNTVLLGFINSNVEFYWDEVDLAIFVLLRRSAKHGL